MILKILLVGSEWYGGVTEYCEDALNDLGHTVRKFYYERDYASLSFLGKIQERFYMKIFTKHCFLLTYFIPFMISLDRDFYIRGFRRKNRQFVVPS